MAFTFLNWKQPSELALKSFKLVFPKAEIMEVKLRKSCSTLSKT